MPIFSSPISVKSDKPIRPGSWTLRNMISRSGPCWARHARILRSNVRRICGSGRRRPRVADFCDGRRRSCSIRYALATLIPVRAAATDNSLVILDFM